MVEEVRSNWRHSLHSEQQHDTDGQPAIRENEKIKRKYYF